ncbi:MAG: vanadium-dependent haloperoxidase [Chloroflexia bacterium]
MRVDQRQKTAQAGTDYMTTFPNWLNVQRGVDFRGTDVFEPNRLFIRSLRDLATYVHFDQLYEAYLNACLILLEMRVPFDPGNPYRDSRNQDGFATFGGPHVLSLVTEVATRALKAVWWQKWGVHRRLRPEAFGGRIHVHRNIDPGRYPMINVEILNSSVVPIIEAQFGTTLLPQAFPEGSPTHPSYGAGHATVAGACVTILKAWFDESFVMTTAPVQSNAAGTALVPAPAAALTVGGELNKLAANVAIGRNAGGVHWLSDYTQSIRLGEQIAISILLEQKLTYNEDHHLSLTTFDGKGLGI